LVCTGVILSSISVEELDTWVGLLVLSATTLAYTGGCKWKLCEVGVASALFIGAAYDYNFVISNSTPCPFLGDINGSFAMSQWSIGCFMYSIGLCYCTPSSLQYTSLLLYAF
jgi:hypothetical protein